MKTMIVLAAGKTCHGYPYATSIPDPEHRDTGNDAMIVRSILLHCV